MIVLSPTEIQIILTATGLAIGYLFAKYPIIPGTLNRGVQKVKAGLLQLKADDNVPEELVPLYDKAVAEIEAYEAAMADGKLTWRELWSLGTGAYELGKAALAMIRR